jgi:DNA repair protein RadC
MRRTVHNFDNNGGLNIIMRGSMSSPKDSEPGSSRERLAKYGAEHLSTCELLAVLLHPGYSRHKATEIAANLLKAFDGDLTDMLTATIHQLTQVGGIGFVKACKIKATFELGKRISSYCEEMHPQIKSTEDVTKLLAPQMRYLKTKLLAPQMRYLKQEEFRVLLLNSKKRLIRHCRVSLGSLDAALVEPRDVFRPAIATNVKSIILVHDHPSGDPEPSEQDTFLTQQLCLCGKIVGIDIVDHIIIGFSKHVSLKDQGKIIE